MPIPTPNQGEEQKDFISRCMGDEVMVKDYPDAKQRSAICYKQWNEKDLSEGEKFYDMPMETGEPYKAFGGAETFEEVDQWEEANEKRREIEKVTWTAQDLMSNVMNSDDDFNKPNKLQRIVDGLRAKLMKLMSKDKDADYIPNEDIKVSPSEVISPAEKQIPDKIGSFHITKKDGVMRWIGFPSNKWRDRDNPPQIIEEKAHKEFVAHMEKTGDYPVLLGWHTPGTQLGKADFAEYIDGFLVMGGTIDKDKYQEAENLAELSLKEKIGMSHGFVYKYSDEPNEIIGWYRTWEVSHLPLDKAANLWTSIDIIEKEVKEMPLKQDRREYLDSVYGKDTIDKVLSQIEDTGKSLSDMGVEYKEVLPEDQLIVNVDQDEIVEKSVKAIVENEAFKAMVASIGTMAEKITELTDTTIPEMQKQIDEAKGTADNAEKTAQQKTDDIVANAFTSKVGFFQASVKGEEPSEEEKKKEQQFEPTSPIDPAFRSMMLGEYANAP